MSIPSEIRDQVYKRDGFKCRACKSRDNLHVHHIIFKSHGGPDETWNLVTLCSSCHSKVHDTVGPEKLIVLAKSGNPDDQADANVGLKFRVVKRKKNVMDVSPEPEPIDTDNLTPNTAFRVEASARYSKTYTGYVDLGNYRTLELAQKRLCEVTAEGYQNARVKRVELD